MRFPYGNPSSAGLCFFLNLRPSVGQAFCLSLPPLALSPLERLSAFFLPPFPQRLGSLFISDMQRPFTLRHAFVCRAGGAARLALNLPRLAAVRIRLCPRPNRFAQPRRVCPHPLYISGRPVSAAVHSSPARTVSVSCPASPIGINPFHCSFDDLIIAQACPFCKRYS
jgi:hypothetical protein